MPYVENMTREELESQPAATLGVTGIDPRTGYRPPPISPTREQVWTAAFEQSNMVVNLAERMFRDVYPAVDGYSAIDEIAGSRYHDMYGDRFIHSRSPQETAQIKTQIDQEERNQQIMAQGGAGGVIAGMVAGNLDPTLFLPGAVAIKAGRGGLSFSRAALSVAPAVAMQTGIQEAALQMNQQTRTAGEGVANVATSTIVGAVLGGGAARLLTGPERAYITKQAELLRRDLDIQAAGGRSVPSAVAEPTKGPTVTTHNIAGGQFDTLGPSPAMASGASGLSAAATDERTVELVSTPGLGWTKSWSPTRQVLSAASQAARRILIDLADVPYRTTAALSGALSVQGPAVDLLVKMQLEGAKYDISQELTRLYGNMRFQREDTIAPRARAALQDLTGTKGMTYTQFKREVSLAAMSQDKHVIPEVEAAAQYIRRRVFEPISAEAERILPGFKKIDPVTGESYFPHYWDRQKIIDNKDKFTDSLTEHYVADQDYKFKLQESLRWKNAQLNSINDNIGKLEAMAARAEAAAHEIDVRAAERSRDDMGKVVSVNEPDVPGGRVAELQVRKVTRAEEAKEFADMLDLLDELQKGNIVIPKIQKRVLGQFEQAEKESLTATAQHKEAGIAAGRSERRLAFLEEKLSAKQSRVELIEDQLIVARQLHDEIRKTIEEDIAKWQGGTTVDAKAAIRAREKSASQKALEQAGHRMEGPQLPEARVGERLKSADAAVDKAVRNILESRRDLSREEMQGISQQTVDRILGSPDGRLAYEGDGNPISKLGKFAGPDEAARRGSEASRVLNVTNAWAKDYLVDDIEQVATAYMRTFLPDIHLTDRFGDAELNTVKRLINEDYHALGRDAKTVAEKRALQAEQDEVIKNIAAIRDRTRGVYGWNANGENMARVAKGVKTANNIMLMGSSAVASLVDLTGTIWRQGLLSTFADGWIPFVRALSNPEFRELWKAHTAEMRAMGIGVETALGLRQHSLDDVTDSIRPHSKFERGLDWVGDKFFVANLLNPLTDMEKLIAGHVAMSNIIEGSRALAVGKATQKQIADLADVGIDVGMAQRIWDNFSAKQHRLDAIQENGVYIANTADWADRQAALVLNGAVRHEVDIAVVTPGQEKPKWMSLPVLGLLGQFKSFTAAAMERTLIANVQRRDMASLQGLIASTAAGGMVYALQQVLAGKDITTDPGTFAREAMARAGWPAWGEEFNSFSRKMTGWDMYSPITDKESTKYQSRRALDTALGPTWTNAQNVASVVKGGAAELKGFVFGKTAADGSGWSASTTTSLRRLMPVQNGVGVRRVYDAVEEGFNNAFGIKPKRAPPAP
jgi:hypothetical protein